MPRHLEHHVYAKSSGLLHHDRFRVFFRRIDHVVGLHLSRDLAPVLVYFDGEQTGRAHGPSYGDGKKPDRPAARDGHGFCSDLTGEHGMDGIAQRIENRGILRRNGGIKFPDIRFRNDDVLGEGAVGIDADDLHVLANVSFAGAALQALAARHVHLGGNKIAFLHAGHFIAERGHLAAKLVSGNQRRMNTALGPAIPVINMQVGAADGGHPCRTPRASRRKQNRLPSRWSLHRRTRPPRRKTRVRESAEDEYGPGPSDPSYKYAGRCRRWRPSLPHATCISAETKSPSFTLVTSSPNAAT